MAFEPVIDYNPRLYLPPSYLPTDRRRWTSRLDQALDRGFRRYRGRLQDPDQPSRPESRCSGMTNILHRSLPSGREIWATITERDAVIFYDNDLRCLLTLTATLTTTHELEINAHNTVWDLFLPKPYRDGGPPTSPDIRGLKTAAH